MPTLPRPAGRKPLSGQAPFSGASGPSHSASSPAAAAAAAADGGSSGPAAGDGEPPPTFPGAPERDPWSDGDALAPGGGRPGPGKFEEELAREERELFGDKSGADKSN